MQISFIIKQSLMITAMALMLLSPTAASDFKTLRTPNNTEFIGYIFTEISQGDIEKKDRQYEQMIKEAGWSAIKLAASSGTYNSHGYAWHMSRGGAEIIIDGDDVPQYWMDGSYQQIDENEAVEGDIIVITDPDHPSRLHSAVVADEPRWCISKWYDGPLFLHKLDEHPFGNTFTFYRRAAPAAPQNLRIVR